MQSMYRTAAETIIQVSTAATLIISLKTNAVFFKHAKLN